jgi:hypothetical protein
MMHLQTVIASIACVRCHHTLTAAQSLRPVIYRRALHIGVIGEVVKDLHASL